EAVLSWLLTVVVRERIMEGPGWDHRPHCQQAWGSDKDTHGPWGPRKDPIGDPWTPLRYPKEAIRENRPSNKYTVRPETWSPKHFPAQVWSPKQSRAQMWSPKKSRAQTCSPRPVPTRTQSPQRGVNTPPVTRKTKSTNNISKKEAEETEEREEKDAGSEEFQKTHSKKNFCKVNKRFRNVFKFSRSYYAQYMRYRFLKIRWINNCVVNFM
ncbi:unnamed protein product, partial [Meganyctiphanes norvegica]